MEQLRLRERPGRPAVGGGCRAAGRRQRHRPPPRRGPGPRYSGRPVDGVPVAAGRHRINGRTFLERTSRRPGHRPRGGARARRAGSSPAAVPPAPAVPAAIEIDFRPCRRRCRRSSASAGRLVVRASWVPSTTDKRDRSAGRARRVDPDAGHRGRARLPAGEGRPVRCGSHSVSRQILAQDLARRRLRDRVDELPPAAPSCTARPARRRSPSPRPRSARLRTA